MFGERHGSISQGELMEDPHENVIEATGGVKQASGFDNPPQGLFGFNLLTTQGKDTR